MAMIHVNRGATSLGVFSEEQIREGLRTGRFASSDIGWRADASPMGAQNHDCHPGATYAMW